jgi:hypothetical protein
MYYFFILCQAFNKYFDHVILFIHFSLSFEGKMPWYVVYRGRNPGVQCHQQVTRFHNSCYKSFTCKDEAIASYLEFTGEAKVHVVRHGLQLINNTISLQIIVIVQFLIILGLLIMIISSWWYVIKCLLTHLCMNYLLIPSCICALLHMSRLGSLVWRQTPPRANGWW